MLGASWIAGRATVPAIAAARNGRLAAIASRDPDRAAALAGEASGVRVHRSYDDLLADPEVDAVYISLVNSAHRAWTERALAAGKHVLCEKPLAVTAADAEAMAAASERCGKLLMEALMYRFHPRLRARVETLREQPVRHAAAWFGFPLQAPDNYRLRPELGGGALLDVGSYCLSACRWLLGEPAAVGAVAHLGETGVDLTVAAALGFPSGATALAWASFESPEHQALEVVLDAGEAVRIEAPFTAWRDPDDPYQLMIEAFGEAVLGGRPAPLPPSESIANLRLLERVRDAAGLA